MPEMTWDHCSVYNGKESREIVYVGAKTDPRKTE